MELFGSFNFEEKNQIYKFIVLKVDNLKAGDGILGVVGDHIRDKTNKDVDAVSICNISLNHFPRLIGQFFPNLKILTVNSCGIKRITRFNFTGLANLEQLMMNGNKITTLPDGLFEDTPALEAVSFYGNKVKFIHSNIFNSLSYLKYANFKMNINIDACYKTTGNGISQEFLSKI